MEAVPVVCPQKSSGEERQLPLLPPGESSVVFEEVLFFSSSIMICPSVSLSDRAMTLYR